MVLQRKWQASRGAEKGRGVGSPSHAATAPDTRAQRDDDAATRIPVAASDTLPARRYGAGVQAKSICELLISYRPLWRTD